MIGVEDRQAADLLTAMHQIVKGIDLETTRIRAKLATTREQIPSLVTGTTIVITFFLSLANLTFVVCDMWLAVILFVFVHCCRNHCTLIGAQTKHHSASEVGRRGEASAAPTS